MTTTRSSQTIGMGLHRILIKIRGERRPEVQTFHQIAMNSMLSYIETNSTYISAINNENGGTKVIFSWNRAALSLLPRTICFQYVLSGGAFQRTRTHQSALAETQYQVTDELYSSSYTQKASDRIHV
jgi:hypothetical protein